MKLKQQLHLFGLTRTEVTTDTVTKRKTWT